MTRFEYASLIIQWDGKGKGIYVRQFGNEIKYSFDVRKKLGDDNHWEYYNFAIGKLGYHGWEMVSVTGLNGSEYSMILDESQTSTIGQELWFKRTLGDNDEPISIEDTLADVKGLIKAEKEESEQEKQENLKNWRESTVNFKDFFKR